MTTPTFTADGNGRLVLSETPLEWPKLTFGTDASKDARTRLVAGQHVGDLQASVVGVERGNDAIAKRIGELPKQVGKQAREAIAAADSAALFDAASEAAIKPAKILAERIAKATAEHPVNDRPLALDEHPAANDSTSPATVGTTFAALASVQQMQALGSRLAQVDPVEVPGRIREAVANRQWGTLFAIDGFADLPHRSDDIEAELRAGRLAFREQVHDSHGDPSRLTHKGLSEATEWARQLVATAAARLQRHAPPTRGRSPLLDAFERIVAPSDGAMSLDQLVDSIQNRTAT
jgi:hypothetical protein